MFADLRNGIANQDAGLDDGRTGQSPRKKGIEKKNGKEQSDRTQASDKTEEEPSVRLEDRIETASPN